MRASLKGFGKKAIFLIIILYLLMISGCHLKSKESIAIRTIRNEKELPKDLADIPLLFEKQINGKTKLFVTDLARSQSHSIDLDKPVNNIRLSPYGDSILYSVSRWNGSDHQNGIFLYNIANNTEKEIASKGNNRQDVTLSTPNYFGNNNIFIFHEYWSDINESKLIMVNKDNDIHETIILDENLGIAPVISPDGMKIIFQCGGVDKETGVIGVQICMLHRKTYDMTLITKSGDYHGSYLFSPDSQRIIYTESEGKKASGFFNSPTQKIYSTDINGSQKKMLIEFSGGIRSISRDGQEIILEGYPNNHYPHSIYIVEIDGKNIRHLTYFDDFLADWYPEDEE